MAERKRRFKTGCLTCRRRRIKCDEKKPYCERCKSAHIICDGYQSPRQLVPSHQSTNQCNDLENQPGFPTPSTITISKVEAPLFAYPNSPGTLQRLHPRAREILGHQQYSSRTAKLLFRHDHLYFWRDYLLGIAWDTEYVFDAVIALGTIHRAVIMLSDSKDKWRGLDNKVAAFQIYATALNKISEQCREIGGIPSEMMIAVLLLLTYFEVCWLVVPNYIVYTQRSPVLRG
jgi:hypothetical protein